MWLCGSLLQDAIVNRSRSFALCNTALSVNTLLNTRICKALATSRALKISTCFTGSWRLSGVDGGRMYRTCWNRVGYECMEKILPPIPCLEIGCAP